MRHIVAKIQIDINLVLSVAATTTKLAPAETADMPEFLAAVGDMIADVLHDYDLKPSLNYGNQVSRRNGGYSLYTIYNYIDDDVHIKLLLDIRLADHLSKPNLAAFVSRSANKLKSGGKSKSNNILEDVDAEALDVYCKQHAWGVQIYIGSSGDTTYNEPVTSLEAARRIIEGKISKFVSKYI